MFFVWMNHVRERIQNALENLRNILGRGMLPRSHFFLQLGMYTCSARVSLQSADDTTSNFNWKILVRAINEIKDFITALRHRRCKCTICKVYFVNRISYLKRNLSFVLWTFQLCNIPIDIHKCCRWLKEKETFSINCVLYETITKNIKIDLTNKIKVNYSL